MEGEGSPSNHEDRPASPEAAKAAAVSSSVASSSESGKISSLDWSASPRRSGNTSSTSNSDESNDSDSEGFVQIMLSDTDAKKQATDVEEGVVGEGSGAAATKESGENLASVSADPKDLIKPSTFYMGRSLMTQSDIDALRLEGCFELGSCLLPGKKTTQKPIKNESVVFRDFSRRGFGCRCQKDLLKFWPLTMFKFIS
jgi:hypothetical protein